MLTSRSSPGNASTAASIAQQHAEKLRAAQAAAAAEVAAARARADEAERALAAERQAHKGRRRLESERHDKEEDAAWGEIRRKQEQLAAAHSMQLRDLERDIRSAPPTASTHVRSPVGRRGPRSPPITVDVQAYPLS